MTERERFRFLSWLETECGYKFVREIPNDHYAAIYPKMFTHAIITGRVGDRVSLGDCWCYPDFASAVRALAAWDGTGEPQGWMRHPDSGRRVSRSFTEIDEAGRPVPIGVAYVRG